MGDVKNLTATAAVEKIREIAEHANICIFVTDLSNLPLAARPMGFIPWGPPALKIESQIFSAWLPSFLK